MNLLNTLHKFATRAQHKLYSFIGFITLGARAIVINSDNQVLLVKHTYDPHWYLPGGGVKRGESAKAAVLRELQEEVGVVTTKEPVLFGIYFHTYLEIDDYPVIYIVKSYSLRNSHSWEIQEKAWFHYEQLPERVSPGTQRRLDEYFMQSIQSEWW